MWPYYCGALPKFQVPTPKRIGREFRPLDQIKNCLPFAATPFQTVALNYF